MAAVQGPSLARRRCWFLWPGDSSGDARRGGGGKEGGGDWSGGGRELGFASLFKHLRINPNRWIGNERTEEAGF